jgi:S1-C subfamily serine protease
MIATVSLLTALVVAQAAALVALNRRLTNANTEQRRVAIAADAKINSLQSRTAQIEAGAKAAMNSEAVATDALPSVFQVDAGDFIGNSFAVTHPSAGGTYLVTNFHVVSEIYSAGTRSVDIDHKDERFTAKIKQIDRTHDLALLYVSDESFPVLKTSTESVVGEAIVALGEPLGLEDTVTTGVISSLDRHLPDEPGISYLQFDAATNPGNSGGPLVNADRQVIGIVTAKFDNAEGLGLALPIATACTTFSIC